MKKEELKKILQSKFDATTWVKLLQFLSGTQNNLTIFLDAKHLDIKTAKAKDIIKQVVQLGSLKTSDNTTLPIYDVTLQDDIKIEYNRVGVNDLLKQFILKDALKGAIVTFHYNKDFAKKEWRFSFISKQGSDYFTEIESVETNPKKYTYIFGTPEEHRTAIERLYNLEQSRFKLDDFFEAFNVEPVSNNFFKEYKQFYQDFVDFLIVEKKYRKLFTKPKRTEADIDKEIRNFVKRLLGRIVFLYFLQKKRWLGATSTNYDDGDTNFLLNLFTSQDKNKNKFYAQCLSPLFFNALNTPNRKKDAFTLPDGTSVCIPFLNGGLFEEQQEPQGHEGIEFPAHLFEQLFTFFNGYNFTIYENSPDDHTVAVDPEMLGHIFENLLEDNKDKGAFYTPKEIVHYMTQESLIEYLKTHLTTHTHAIEDLIKNHNTTHFDIKTLKQVEVLIDNVKICDPAIGSGAFPMGLLQEIFALKALIHYTLGYQVWSPATVKQNIIQNSIYGVDLEPGAVDIARLRFWLSLVVDEPTPKPLPNLDYKIMQGNSLLESFEGIDLSKVTYSNDLVVVENLEKDLFGNFKDGQLKMTISKTGIIEKIQSLMHDYFTAKTTEKPNIKTQINQAINEHIEYNIELRSLQLNRQIADLQSAKLLNTKQQKALENLQTNKAKLKQTKANLQEIESQDEKPYFLWHLFFADVFKQGGFDIVIGNPPYVGVKGNGKTFEQLKNSNLSIYFKGRAELFYFFIHKAIDIGKINCINTFITTNYFITATDANILRQDLKERTTILKLLNFNEIKLFASATGQHNLISMFKKGNDFGIYSKNFLTKNKGFVSQFLLKSILNNVDKNTEYYEISQNELYEGADNYIRIGGKTGGNDALNTIFNAINSNIKLGEICYVRQGLRTGIDKITDIHIQKFNYSGLKGEGVFILTKEELLKKNISIDNPLIKPLYKNSDINKFTTSQLTNQYLLYIDNTVTLNSLKDKNKEIYEHLSLYKNLIKKIRNKNNENSEDWFRLDRSREKWLFEGPKIVAPQRSKSNTFGFNEIDWYSSADIYFIKTNNEQYNLKYILALLNSKLFLIWLSYKGKRKGEMLELYQKPLSEIPILLNSNTTLFENLVDLVIYTKTIQNKSISDMIKNEHIASFFEEVIDGCVFELYFEQHMKEKGIDIISLVEKEINKINNLLEPKNIFELYKTLSTGEVQVRMRNFITQSPDILKVVLQS